MTLNNSTFLAKLNRLIIKDYLKLCEKWKCYVYGGTELCKDRMNP